MFIYCIFNSETKEIIITTTDEISCIKMCNTLNTGRDLYDWRALNLDFLIDFYTRK